MDAPSPLYQYLYPTCKVCDRGTLVPKKIYRMSGPVVAIGFILLIPSILGMAASALIFFGVTAAHSVSRLSTTTIPTPEPIHEDWDTQYRRKCINTPESDTTVPITQRVPYCECTRTEYKKSNSEKYAEDVCSQKLQFNTLSEVSQDTEQLYHNLLGTSLPDVGEVEVQAQPQIATPLFSVLGGTFAIVLGIISFVGGLLGWLLIMKKRVLRCSLCSATVSAS